VTTWESWLLIVFAFFGGETHEKRIGPWQKRLSTGIAQVSAYRVQGIHGKGNSHASRARQEALTNQ
jgi:hypothetical protein